MEYDIYKEHILSRFSNRSDLIVNNFETTVSDEELFKGAWLAAKWKIFSFICYKDVVDLEIIQEFSSTTYDYCRKHYKGLLFGLQGSFMSFSVLASRKVDPYAIQYVCENSKPHYAAFEIPMIYDLESEILYYPKRFPLRGSLYNDFKLGYINRFNIDRNLKFT